MWTIPWQYKYSRPSNNWQKYLNRKGKEITSYFNLEVAVTFPVKKRIFRISCTIGFIVLKLALIAVPLKSLCCCQSHDNKTVLHVKTFSGAQENVLETPHNVPIYFTPYQKV